MSSPTMINSIPSHKPTYLYVYLIPWRAKEKKNTLVFCCQSLGPTSDYKKRGGRLLAASLFLVFEFHSLHVYLH